MAKRGRKRLYDEAYLLDGEKALREETVYKTHTRKLVFMERGTVCVP